MNKHKDKPFIIAGDFNLPHINWNNNSVTPGKPQMNQHLELLNIAADHNLEQLQYKINLLAMKIYLIFILPTTPVLLNPLTLFLVYLIIT